MEGIMVDRDKCLYFKRGYKYQVNRDYHITLDIIPYAPIALEHVTMDLAGRTVINAGYAWNGASGPTMDTLNSMIGSLAHDVGYQLIRLGLIDPGYKPYLDKVLHDLCTEDGMYSWRADYWRWAVLKFGVGSTRPSSEPKEEVAP
jgi:hypothetical protein